MTKSPSSSTPRRRSTAPKRTLASVITAQLRERIVAGELAPGTQMNEAELAARFATSRGPIREGMQRLVQEGLLVSTPHRGIFVPELTQDDVTDLYFARAALERAAMLRLVDRGMTASVIAQLEQVLEEMTNAVDAHDHIAVSAADLRFHEVVVAAARSPRVELMYQMLSGQTRLGLNLLTRDDDHDDRLGQHTAILRMLIAGDRSALLTLLDEHYDDALEGGGHQHPHSHTHDEANTTRRVTRTAT